MTDNRAALGDLLNQRAALDAQIAKYKADSIDAVRELMQVTGVTLADLGGAHVTAKRGTGAKRPVKYRDADGNTWTGIGQRPRWVQKALAAGKSLDEFAVR
jgi:DNA-binding protein H-NS